MQKFGKNYLALLALAQTNYYLHEKRLENLAGLVDT